MPTGSSTIPLINTMFLFSSRGHIEESQEIDFLVAQSLVNGRKFIQASEKFRAIQNSLLQKLNRDDLYRSMLIEMIIGESMSQHSQISEKVFAFKRATFIQTILTQDSINFSSVKQQLAQIPKDVVKQEDAPQKLLVIKQNLVQILIQNLSSHFEVVRNAMLKTLEYLLDALNCSLEQNLVSILRAVCFCYPESPQFINSANCQSVNLLPEVAQGFFQFRFSQQVELSKPIHFFSLFSIHSEQDCQVKEVKTQSQLFIQSTRNSYNHILENLSIVLASASHNLLLQVFNKIIVPESLNQNLPQELRIYLLKFANQILEVCSDDLVFPGNFLTEVVEVILETPKRQTSATKAKPNPLQRNRVQSAATQAVSPHFSNLQQVCNQLFQTMNTKYFSYFSSKAFIHQDYGTNDGQRKNQLTFDWLMSNLQQICCFLIQKEQSQSTFQVSDFRRLNLLLGIVDNVVSTILNEQKSGFITSGDDQERQSDKVRSLGQARLQFMFNREAQEAENELTFASKSYENINMLARSQKNLNYSHTYGNSIHNRMHYNMLYLQVFLPLTQPLIKLLTFSVASQERIVLFKQIWRLLTQVISCLPVSLTKMQNLTLPNLIKPHLTQLTIFMQNSSPSKHMLEFLHIVLSSVQLPQNEYEELLFPTLLKTIPHNLHDEAFKVTSLMLDLLKGPMSQRNLKLLISVLVHKYTMRSKEHTVLVQKVVQKVLLGRNSRQILDFFLSECLIENVLQISYGAVSPEEEAIYFEKLSLLWEVVERMSSIHIWHFRRILNCSLEQLKRVFSYNSRSQHFVVKLLYRLTYFYLKHCASYNHYEHLRVQHQPVVILGNQVNAQQEIIPLIRNQFNFYQNQAAIYSEPSAELFSIGHHEDEFYVSAGLEDPHVEMDPQVAAYLIPEVEPNNRRQRVHYQSQHVEYQPQALFNNLVAEDEIQQQSELYESPRQVPQFGTQTLCNDVMLINRDRQILIKIHACLLKQITDGQSDYDALAQSIQISRDLSFTNYQTRPHLEDVDSRLCALNLMLNLFKNLLPLPTLQNLVVQETIIQDREQINLVEPVRMLYFQDDEGGLHQSEDSVLSEEIRIQPQRSQALVGQREDQAQPQPPIEGAQPRNQEIIPELADLIISGEEEFQQLQEGETSFPAEFECVNVKYICSRVLMFLNVSKYLEHTIKTSSWASLKSLAISVLASACQIPDVAILPPKLQRHFKNFVQPLLVRLLQSQKDSEAKATSLSILSGLCNMQLRQSNTIDLNNLQFDQDHDTKDYSRSNMRTWQQPILSDHLGIFRANSSFISVAIWQDVFDLQDDQNFSIRQAAAALVQLCVPEESLKHFQKMRYEQYKLRASEVLQNSLIYFQENYAGSQTPNHSETMLQNLSQSKSKLQIDTSDMHLLDDASSQSSQSSNHQDLLKITEDELVNVLEFFHMKCHPLTSLLAERPAYHRDQNPENSINQVGTRVGSTRQDFFEDGLLLDDRFQLSLNRNRSKGVESNEDDDEESLKSSSSDEVYIFRRQDSRNRQSVDLLSQAQGESKQSGSNVFFTAAHLTSSQSQDNNEDLGIIDLDNCEMTQEDDFDELDDEKLPVLKNIYSKKNRPNNSKSVAVGSRSQGGVLKPRQMSGKRQYIIEDEEDKAEVIFKDEQASVTKQESENHRSMKQLKKAIRSSLEVKDEERNETLLSDLQLESRSSFQIIRRNEKDIVKVVEIDSSSGEKISVVSLPVASRRQIQSAGGKRGDQSGTSSREKRQNLHFLSQGDTLYIPANLEDVDIEEVQIFVRQKRSKRLRTQTSMHSAQQSNSRSEAQVQQRKTTQQQNTLHQQQQSASNMF